MSLVSMQALDVQWDFARIADCNLASKQLDGRSDK
jgi:hypothetical protein